MVSSRAGTPYGNPVSGRVVPSVSSSQPFRRVKLCASPGSACGTSTGSAGRSGRRCRRPPPLHAQLFETSVAAVFRVAIGVGVDAAAGQLARTAAVRASEGLCEAGLVRDGPRVVGALPCGFESAFGLVGWCEAAGLGRRLGKRSCGGSWGRRRGSVAPHARSRHAARRISLQALVKLKSQVARGRHGPESLSEIGRQSARISGELHKMRVVEIRLRRKVCLRSARLTSWPTFTPTARTSCNASRAGAGTRGAQGTETAV